MTDTLCGLLKQARLRLGLTQEQAGDLIYLSGNGYGKVERGLRDLDTKQLLLLCRGLGVPVSEMFRALECDPHNGYPACDDYHPEGGTMMEMNSGRKTVMDAAKSMMSKGAAEHADFICLAVGLDYQENQPPEANLARLLVEIAMNGDRQVMNPGKILQDALDVKRGHGFTLAPPELQDEAANIALGLIDYWDRQRSLELKSVLRNILLHTDFDGLDACPGYARRIHALQQKFRDAEDARNADYEAERAREIRLQAPLKPGCVVKLHDDRAQGGYEYGLLVNGGEAGRRAKSYHYIILHQDDKHTILNTVMDCPYIKVHIGGGLCPEVMYADTSVVYSLAHEGIYDVAGEIDKPALDTIRDIIDAHFSSETRPPFDYGSCIQYTYKGTVRRGIVVRIDDRHIEMRLLDVFFLTDAEAAADPACIKLAKDERDPDGQLFYNFDFPENVSPYLRRGCITHIQCIPDDITDVKKLGAWPSMSDANDRIRDLMPLVEERSAGSGPDATAG